MPNEGPILNVNKFKFRTHVEKSVVFEIFKEKQCIIPRNKIISGKPP